MTFVLASFLKSLNAHVQSATKNVLVTKISYNSYSSVPKEELINIDSQKINYLKTGNGTNKVLCFPGFLGTIWSDFKPQIEGLDKNKLTVVVWDPPGHGKSRPPERYLSSAKFYEEDADFAFQLMKSLGISRFSLLGWSDGGISSMILAAKYPAVVEKLIIWGANTSLLPEDLKGIERLSDLDNWSEKAKKPLLEIYGEKTLRDLHKSWCNAMKDIENKGCDICTSCLKDIQCPTLILHGDQDSVISSDHPTFLLENIKRSKLHRFPKGKHNIHLRYATEFNNIVTRFLQD